jgi:prophage DNA circulation protein
MAKQLATQWQSRLQEDVHSTMHHQGLLITLAVATDELFLALYESERTMSDYNSVEDSANALQATLQQCRMGQHVSDLFKVSFI